MHPGKQGNEIFIFQAMHKLCSIAVSILSTFTRCYMYYTCCSVMSSSLELPRVYCIWPIVLKDSHFGRPCICYMKKQWAGLSGLGWDKM
jgi:hypothetical protein